MNRRQKKKQINCKPFDKVKLKIHSEARCEIAVYIVKKAIKAGIKPNTRAIWSYTRWLAHNLSEGDWYALVARSFLYGILSKPITEFGEEEQRFLKAIEAYRVKEEN